MGSFSLLLGVGVYMAAAQEMPSCPEFMKAPVAGAECQCGDNTITLAAAGDCCAPEETEEPESGAGNGRRALGRPRWQGRYRGGPKWRHAAMALAASGKCTEEGKPMEQGDIELTTADDKTAAEVKTQIEGSNTCKLINCSADEKSTDSTRRAMRAPGVAPKPVFERRLSENSASKTFTISATNAPDDYTGTVFAKFLLAEDSTFFTSVKAVGSVEDTIDVEEPTAAPKNDTNANNTNDTAPASLFNGVLAASAGVALSTLF